MTSVRGQLRQRRVAELAERQRRRTGIWFDQAGRVCQHCPACTAAVSTPDPPGSDDPAGFAAYARAVDEHLDDAVFHHLVLDLCPSPERAL